MTLINARQEAAKAHQLAADNQLRKQLSEEFGANQADVYVLRPEELKEVWRNHEISKGKTPEQVDSSFEEITGLVNNHTGAVLSTALLLKLADEMHRSGNILGGYRVIQKEGKDFLLFSGKASMRKHLNARMFAANDPRVVKLGVGRMAANAGLKSGIVLAFILSPAIRSVEWLFGDNHKFIESVLAHISTDLVKASISGLVGYLATVGTAAVFGASVVAVAPLAAGIAVGIFIGSALNAFDEESGVTQKVTEVLVSVRAQWEISAKRNRAEWEKTKRDISYYLFTTEGQIEFMQKFTGGYGSYY